MSRESSNSWSIDELAALVGVPTRTIREYRTIGLIEPPRKDGRVGRYDESHRQRLELIARLQERGYSLAAIRDLCSASASGRSLDDILGGSAAAAIDQGAMSYSTDELLQAVPALADEGLRNAAIEAGLIQAGLIRAITDRAITDRAETEQGAVWHVRAPALLSLVGDAIGAGVGPGAAIRMAAELAAGARVQASAFADMVVGELWNQDGSTIEALVSTGRRARMQLTQAVASLVVHEVGRELRARATMPGLAGMDELVDRLRVGVVRSRGATP